MSYHHLWLSWLFFVVSQQAMSTINLTLNMQDSQAVMVGIQVTLRDETGLALADCVSDENGRCPLTLTAPTGSIIRGTLDFGSNGKRSLIFTIGEDLDLTLQFDRFGQVQVPVHAPHPTLESFEPPAIPTLAPAHTPTAEQPNPSPIYVVIDPEMTPETAVTETVADIDFVVATETPLPKPVTEPRTDWVRIIIFSLAIFVISLGLMVLFGGRYVS